MDHEENPPMAQKHDDPVLDMRCTATVDYGEVRCALPKHPGDVHACGFLMWQYWGEYAFYWWTCRQYDENGQYIFPGDPRWKG